MGETGSDNTNSGNRASETKSRFDREKAQKRARDEATRMERDLDRAEAYRQIGERKKLMQNQEGL